MYSLLMGRMHKIHALTKSKINNHRTVILVQQYCRVEESKGIRVQYTNPGHCITHHSPASNPNTQSASDDMSQPFQNPRRKELGRALRQPARKIPTPDQVEQLPALNELDEHVDAHLILEGVDELVYEEVVELDQYGSLALGSSGLSLVESSLLLCIFSS